MCIRDSYLNVQTYPLVPVNYQSIRPGEVWLDTEGKPIQAHGFQVTFRKIHKTQDE